MGVGNHKAIGLLPAHLLSDSVGTTAGGREFGEREGIWMEVSLGKVFQLSLQTLSNNSFSWHFSLPLMGLFLSLPFREVKWLV